MSARAWLLLVVLPQVAFAQSRWRDEDDAPIPYSDEEEEEDGNAGSARQRDRGRRNLPGRSDPSADLREEADWEQEERTQRLARLDDPQLGLGGEVLLGSLLLSSPRGAIADPSLAFGARFNWEVGRLLAIAPWDEALFADVTWAWARRQGGTERLFAGDSHHLFSVAPAYEVSVGGGHDYGFYAQLGGGLAYDSSTITSDGQQTLIAGIKPLFQYGVGFRGRPELSPGGVRLVFRLEATRFRRGYMNDLLLAGSFGAAF